MVGIKENKVKKIYNWYFGRVSKWQVYVLIYGLIGFFFVIFDEERFEEILSMASHIITNVILYCLMIPIFLSVLMFVFGLLCLPFVIIDTLRDKD